MYFIWSLAIFINVIKHNGYERTYFSSCFVLLTNIFIGNITSQILVFDEIILQFLNFLIFLFIIFLIVYSYHLLFFYFYQCLQQVFLDLIVLLLHPQVNTLLSLTCIIAITIYYLILTTSMIFSIKSNSVFHDQLFSFFILVFKVVCQMFMMSLFWKIHSIILTIIIFMMDIFMD